MAQRIPVVLPKGVIVLYTTNDNVMLPFRQGALCPIQQEYHRYGGNSETAVSVATKIGFSTTVVERFLYRGYLVLVLVGTGRPRGFQVVPFRLPQDIRTSSSCPVNLQDLLCEVRDHLYEVRNHLH